MSKQDNFIPATHFYFADKTSSNGVTTVEWNEENPDPAPQYKYYVIVGGGYRGFKTYLEAYNYAKSD